MSQVRGVHRKEFLVAAGVSASASVALFIFQPIPPIGLVAAIELAVVAVIWLYQALFPAHADRMQQRTEPMTKPKDDPNEPARWVP